jgi:hypothetical protein
MSNKSKGEMFAQLLAGITSYLDYQILQTIINGEKDADEYKLEVTGEIVRMAKAIGLLNNNDIKAMFETAKREAVAFRKKQSEESKIINIDDIPR